MEVGNGGGGGGGGVSSGRIMIVVEMRSGHCGRLIVLEAVIVLVLVDIGRRGYDLNSLLVGMLIIAVRCWQRWEWLQRLVMLVAVRMNA